jgi:hypothetical protein
VEGGIVVGVGVNVRDGVGVFVRVAVVVGITELVGRGVFDATGAVVGALLPALVATIPVPAGVA